MYFIRYGIIDWAPTYLKEVKHFSVDKQSWAYFLYEYAGIFGMLASGYLSDKVFKGHRAPPMLLFLTGVLIAIIVYWKNPEGNPLVDNILSCCYRFLNLWSSNDDRASSSRPCATCCNRYSDRSNWAIRLLIRFCKCRLCNG